MLEDITTLIRNRRTLKPDLMDPDRALGTALLTHLLENATWAPTHGLTQPWRFHVFSGESRTALAEALQRCYRETTAAADFREDKYEKMGRNPLLAPVVLACCVEKRGGEKIPFIEEIEAVSCALQNLMLSATAVGVGSFWSSPPVLDAPAFLEWLGQGSEDRCVGLIYLGWPREGVPEPRSIRTPVAEKITWHGLPD